MFLAHFRNTARGEGRTTRLHLFFRVHSDALVVCDGVTVTGRVIREIFTTGIVEGDVVAGEEEDLVTTVLGGRITVGLAQGVGMVVLDLVLSTTLQYSLGSEPLLVVDHVGTGTQRVRLVLLLFATHVHLLLVESAATDAGGHGPLAAGVVHHVLTLFVVSELLETGLFLLDFGTGLLFLLGGVAGGAVGTVSVGLPVDALLATVPRVEVGVTVLPLDAGQDDGDEPDRVSAHHPLGHHGEETLGVYPRDRTGYHFPGSLLDSLGDVLVFVADRPLPTGLYTQRTDGLDHQQA